MNKPTDTQPKNRQQQDPSKHEDSPMQREQKKRGQLPLHNEPIGGA